MQLVSTYFNNLQHWAGIV